MSKRVKLGISVVLFMLLIFGVSIVSKNLIHQSFYGRISLQFVEQANSLWTNLEPGGSGTKKLGKCDADELILLGAYCDRAEISRRLPDRPSDLVDDLHGVSGNDRKGTVLVWLRDGEVVSVNPVKFTRGYDIQVHVWTIGSGREIVAKKEIESKNSFLSIYFVDAEKPKP